VFRLLAPYFFTNSSKEVSKKVPPRHPSFYFALKAKSRKIKVPSSVLIFVAAAESPTKITPSSAWLMGTKSKSKD